MQKPWLLQNRYLIFSRLTVQFCGERRNRSPSTRLPDDERIGLQVSELPRMA